MPEAPRAPKGRLNGVQTPEGGAVLGSPRCEVCGRPLGPRARRVTAPQRVCSARCRGIRWRQAKQQTQRSRDQEIRVLLETALKKLEGAP
jgi:hypothetical protein